LHLHSPPLPLAVVALAPDGPPVQLLFAQQTHRVARCWGPERIETGWWRGYSVRRDYYRLETDQGHWFWVFRHLHDGQWFLHGMFT
jgi:protein ImuB